MIERSKIGLVMLMLAVAAACVPGEKAGDPDEATAKIEAVPSGAATGLPPASVLIGHRVADYDVWKRAFDDHLEAREDASCLGHYLKRGLDNPEMVYIYCLATNVDKLRMFLESPELVDVMRNAGVQGEPEITLMKPMSRNLVPERLLPGIIVMHPVEDYDTWRLAYDELGDFRRQSGIVGHAVSREYDNPNQVIVYHQANDVTDLRAFVDSQELEETMKRARVVGQPDVRFIQVVDFARY